MANTEYYKQVATLSTEEHMARIAAGLTKRDYLKTITDKDGKVRQEVREGAEFVPGTGLNTIETDCKAKGIDNELTKLLQLLFKKLSIFKENLMLVHID